MTDELKLSWGLRLEVTAPAGEAAPVAPVLDLVAEERRDLAQQPVGQQPVG